ncbi:MAG: hypothetical protein ACOC2H_00840 [Spirochaetota bacterium]
MNLYTGLAQISIPHSDTVNRIYFAPRYRKDPVHPVGAVGGRSAYTHAESNIGKLARTRMTDAVSPAADKRVSTVLPSKAGSVRQISAETVGTFFDSYA